MNDYIHLEYEKSCVVIKWNKRRTRNGRMDKKCVRERGLEWEKSLVWWIVRGHTELAHVYASGTVNKRITGFGWSFPRSKISKCSV